MKSWIYNTGMLGLFALFPWASQATEIYKLTEDNDVVRMSDIPPAGNTTKKMRTIRADDRKSQENAQNDSGR